MKTLFAKVVCLLTALLLMAGALSACGEKDTPPGDGTQPPSQDTNGPGGNDEDLYDSKGYLKDSLPETYDFDSDFQIYTWDDQQAWEWVDADSEVEGTLMQKLVERQRNVEDRFGVTIQLTKVHGSWDQRTAFIQTLANNVQSNMHTYDLVGQYTPAAGIGAMQGLYYDLNEVPYFDLEKPWWPELISQTATIGDKLYFTTGDITPTLIRNVHSMFVNTDLYDSLGLADLAGGRSIYDVVRDMDWTLEMLQTMGIGTVGNQEGMYGITFDNNVQADAFFYGGGFMLVENVDGVLLPSQDLSGAALNDYFDRIKDLFVGEYDDVAITTSSAFKAKQSVFYSGTISQSQLFTEEGVRFSVLPMPMRSSEQERYYTCASFWVTMYSVPSDADSLDMSGMILEALGSEAYRTLSDEIYYNIFQSRYNADDGADSAEMFDIVSASVVFDTARMFADELAMFSVFRTGVSDTSDPNGSWSSIYGGLHTTWEEKIADIYGKVG